jgi:hypothetical protein
MKYKVRSLRNFKRRNFFETYEPEKRIKLKKEQAVPLLIKLGDIGGTIGFWASSFLVAIKSFFGIKKKAERFSFNKKIIEFRIKKH